jgi:hypothetical protein
VQTIQILAIVRRHADAAIAEKASRPHDDAAAKKKADDDAAVAIAKKAADDAAAAKKKSDDDADAWLQRKRPMTSAPLRGEEKS